MKRPSRNTKKSKGKQRNKYLLSSKKRSKGRTAKHKVKSDLKRNSENLHDRVDSSKTFSCKQCGKSYTRLQDLSRHELSHRRNKVYVCKICDKTLRRSEHLKEHLMTHVIEKPFTCSKCCRGFNRAQQHENHVARCNGEKIYICDICSKVFHREDSMEVHRMMHPDKLPILPTLEKLGNISEYYMEICKDEETMFTDASEEEEEANDFNVTEGVVESKLELSENQDQEIIDETPITSNQVLLDILESDKSDEEINDESENADVMVEIGNNFNFDSKY